MLFALAVALVVACSEGVLYLIWEGRRNKRRERRTETLRFGGRRVARSRFTKDDEKKRDENEKQEMEESQDEVKAITTAKTERKSGLRERAAEKRATTTRDRP